MLDLVFVKTFDDIVIDPPLLISYNIPTMFNPKCDISCDKTYNCNLSVFNSLNYFCVMLIEITYFLSLV